MRSRDSETARYDSVELDIGLHRASDLPSQNHSGLSCSRQSGPELHLSANSLPSCRSAQILHQAESDLDSFVSHGPARPQHMSVRRCWTHHHQATTQQTNVPADVMSLSSVPHRPTWSPTACLLMRTSSARSGLTRLAPQEWLRSPTSCRHHYDDDDGTTRLGTPASSSPTALTARCGVKKRRSGSTFSWQGSDS